MLTIESCSETGRFRHISNHAFSIQLIRIFVSYESLLLAKSSKFDIGLRYAAKNSKELLNFEISPFQLVGVISRYY